ncbi:MAG: lysophospholipid acyltransferase family protein [Burkholderiales bacterium]
MSFPVLGDAVPQRDYGILHPLARSLLNRLGWQITGNLPDVPRMVVAVAPHTTNWDFFLGIAVLFALNVHGNFLGKHTIFRWPVNHLMRWLGGIPVDRTASHGVVGETVSVFRSRDRMLLGVAPEGTRSTGAKWKSGFYHIAKQVGVPIVPVYFDYREKIVALGQPLMPGDNMGADLKILQDYCARATPR